MATLVYSDADGVDRSFSLGGEPVMVGRSAECAIRSDDPRVSRMHARFFIEGGALWIEDLGSANGVYVGANRVQQRAPVPTGEIILVGSLMIRLLPASGTLPPPVGLHGTLATWLDQERKARAAVEEERDAFAQRVGELHQQMAHRAIDSAGDTSPGHVAMDALLLRDQAEARVALLESELEELRQALPSGDTDADISRLRGELATARDRIAALEQERADQAERAAKAEWSSAQEVDAGKLARELQQVRGALEEAEAARSIAEHAAGEAMRDAQLERDKRVAVERESSADLEAARLELEKTREAQIFAETAVGVVAAERLAESDRVIADLRRQLSDAIGPTTLPDPGSFVPLDQHRETTDQLTTLTSRAERAEKDLAAAQIRAQGAERSLSQATSQATLAEARASELEGQLSALSGKVSTAEAELAGAREQISSLEARAGAADAPLAAAEGRAGKLAAELAELTSQFDAKRDRAAALEKAVAAAAEVATAAETKYSAAKSELVAATGKLAEAEARAAGLQKRVADLEQAEAVVAGAAKARDEAAMRVNAADAKVREAERRADDAEKRASAADTMAKAMAKDVAEALKRAVDSDTRSRTLTREIAELTKRVGEAEGKNSDTAAKIAEADQRAAAAEARVAQIEAEAGTRVAASQKEHAGKLEAREKELTVRLEAAQRELAAERSTALSLVDRKTQLERELADARVQLANAVQRAEDAEGRAAEDAEQIDALQDRVEDLESGMAVAETAQRASLAEAKEQLAALERELAEVLAGAGKSGELVAELRARASELEGQLVEANAARAAAEAALREAGAKVADLERMLDERSGSNASAQDQLEDALSRASEAERKIDALSARAEAADLAIGRAGALQRQLDEALSKLAWLEREGAGKSRDARAEMDAVAADRLVAAEERLAAATARLEELEGMLRKAEARAREAEDRLGESERRTMVEHERAEQLAAQAGQLERRAARGDELTRAAADAERRAREAEQRLADTEQRGHAGLSQVAPLQARIVELEREIEAADNVRSFAAETEREIAQLQRDLRETRQKLTQMTLERDRLESSLRDLREDSDTTNRRAPDYDPESTAQLDVKRYEAMLAKTGALEQQVATLQRDEKTLRARLADTEERLREAMDGPDDAADFTHTGNQLPIDVADHVNVLDESIASLRAEMRAASDETAVMEQSDSVIAVATAVSSAAEHIERAREAVKALKLSIGMP